MKEIYIELRAVSAENFTSRSANLSIKIRQDDSTSFSTIPKILIAKNSELQIVDLDNLLSQRNVFYIEYVFIDSILVENVAFKFAAKTFFNFIV